MPRRAVHLRHHRLPGMELALLDDDAQRLVIAETEDLLHACPAVTLRAFDHPSICHLSPAGGIEGGLGELHQITLTAVARDPAHRSDGGPLLLGLITGEPRCKATLAGKPARIRACPRRVGAGSARARPGATARALLLHQGIEVTLDRETLL